MKKPKEPTTDRRWPVLEDLPESERAAFKQWLRGKTIPINDDKTVGFYWHDYQRWQSNITNMHSED